LPADRAQNKNLTGGKNLGAKRNLAFTFVLSAFSFKNGIDQIIGI
jgi:hypothetical protein